MVHGCRPVLFNLVFGPTGTLSQINQRDIHRWLGGVKLSNSWVLGLERAARRSFGTSTPEWWCGISVSCCLILVHIFQCPHFVILLLHCPFSWRLLVGSFPLVSLLVASFLLHPRYFPLVLCCVFFTVVSTHTVSLHWLEEWVLTDWQIAFLLTACLCLVDSDRTEEQFNSVQWTLCLPAGPFSLQAKTLIKDKKKYTLLS